MYNALVLSLSWLRITRKPAQPQITAKEVKRYILRKKKRQESRHGFKRPALNKQQVLSIYKVVKEEHQKHEKREKIVERYQVLIQSVWYFGILGLLYYIYLNFIRETVLNRNKQIFKMFDDNVVGVSHRSLVESVLQSAVVNQKVAQSLVLLMKEPKIKKLMTDLFIKLLRNPGFSQDTSKLLKNITVEYLGSTDCYEKLVKLIVGEVLRNQRVLAEIFKLSEDYAKGQDKQMLEEKLDKILIGVLEIPAVSEFVCQRIANEVGNAFDERKIHDLAIKTAIQNLKK